MPAGRPTLLNDRTATLIIAAIQTGTPVHAATRYAGIHESTLYKWRKQAEASERLPIRRQSAAQRRLIEFFKSLDEAIAECAVRMQAVIFETATSGSILRDASGAVVRLPTVEERALATRYAAWWLSHRMASDYRTSVEISAPSGGPVQMTASITDVIAAMTRAKRAAGAGATDDE